MAELQMEFDQYDYDTIIEEFFIVHNNHNFTEEDNKKVKPKQNIKISSKFIRKLIKRLINFQKNNKQIQNSSNTLKINK